MIANLLVALVALLHIYFMVLEMFYWTKPLGLKIFRQTPEKAEASKVLAQNQGLYNGFLAAGLFWSVLYPSVQVGNHISIFFLICVIIAGIFGAMTVHRRIFYIQSGPALLALAATLWL